MAYTPGPWEFNQSTLGAYAISAKVGPLMVCPAIAHGLEDARLIAAAPDLLAALEAIAQRANETGTGALAYQETVFAMHALARAAIAKAEGKV